MGKGKSAKGKKTQARKLLDLPANSKRAASVKGGIITGAGPGGGPHVTVFSEKTK